MKTIIFFNQYTFAAAAIKTLRLKPGFLPKNLTVLRSLGEKPGFLTQVWLTSGAVTLRVNTAFADRLYTKQKTPTP